MPDRPGGIEVVDALVRAAARFGWRTEVAEVSDFQVRILVLPPLAGPDRTQPVAARTRRSPRTHLGRDH